MKKIFMTVLLCFVAVFATTDPVITFKKSYDAVKVNKPAISKKIICITRVMINEGLLENGQCPIDEVYVLNNKNFYIGTLATSIPSESYGTYLDYDEVGGRYHGSGKSIKVKYTDVEPEDASEYNMNMVSCPNGMKPYIENNAFGCKIPYSCAKNMYAYDEFTCYDLPENAIRNLKDGYSCKPGYFKNNQEECEEIVKCDSSEHYNKEENSCYVKPANSHWVSETEWSCNNGYVDIHDYCEPIVTCELPKRYNKDKNTCEQTPENAHWISSIDKYDWACDNGYVQVMNHCEVKQKCSDIQKYNEYSNVCENPPENAKWDYFGNAICNDGYVMHNNECEIKAVCEKYNEYDNSCFEKPEHSHWVDNNGKWECNDGYHEDGFGRCFTCEEPLQYNSNSKTCVSKPKNANWTYEGHWECKDGYIERYGKCEEIPSCWFSRYDASTNRCISKPSDSHWVNDYSTDWEYDEPLNLGQYFSLNHWVSFELMGNSATDLKDYTQYPVVLALNYNIGTKIGNEDLNITPYIDGSMSVFGIEYTKLDGIYSDNSITSLYFKLGIGAELNILGFLANINYNQLFTQDLDNIKFNSYVIDYKFGYAFGEHWLAYFIYETNLIKATTIMKECKKSVMGLGIGYRF